MVRSTIVAPAASGGALPNAANQFGSGGCSLAISGVVELGPNAGQTFQGTLSVSVGQDGAIDSGALQFADGTTAPVVGQITGRSIRFRAGSSPDATITFIGNGSVPVEQCTGDLAGGFVGTGLQNIGVWAATEA